MEIALAKNMGFRELKKAAAILMEIAEHGFPESFSPDDTGLHIYCNPRSGFVCLCNEDGSCAAMHRGKLETLIYLGYGGHEDFYDNLVEKYKRGEIPDEEDIDQLRRIAEQKGDFLI